MKEKNSFKIIPVPTATVKKRKEKEKAVGKEKTINTKFHKRSNVLETDKKRRKNDK